MTGSMRTPAYVMCVVVLALFDLAGQAYGTASTVIRGPHRGAQSGTAIAGAGDVNGDGLDDVLVSTFDSIYVVFGRHSRKPINLGRLGRGGFRIIGSPHGDLGLLNGSVAGVGDQNGDGLADVLVADDHPYIVYGKRDSRTVDLRRLGAGGYRLAGDAFSVANAGDVNGDGRTDFVIGDKELDAGNSPPGGARVVFSAAPGSPVDPAAPTGFDLVSQDNGDFAGQAVGGAGDVNGDGLADIMVGAPNGGPGGADAHGDIQGDISGRVYVVHGKRDGAPVDLQALGGQGFTIFDSRTPDDGGSVGNSVAGVGDLNGDGKTDVAEAGFQSDAAVVFGGSVTGTLDISQLGGAGILVRGSRNGGIGYVAGLGNANGAGAPAIGLGATTVRGIRIGGAAYVMCGDSGLPVMSLSPPSPCVRPVVKGGVDALQVAGIGDFNGDGLSDMLASNWDLRDDAPRSPGTSYVIYGSQAS